MLPLDQFLVISADVPLAIEDNARVFVVLFEPLLNMDFSTHCQAIRRYPPPSTCKHCTCMQNVDVIQLYFCPTTFHLILYFLLQLVRHELGGVNQGIHQTLYLKKKNCPTYKYTVCL